MKPLKHIIMHLSSSLLWSMTGLFSLGLVFARALYPELLGLTLIVALLLITCFGLLLFQNQKSLKSRSMTYGLHSVVTTLLIFGILGVLNFLLARYPAKLDLTKNKEHTLSDQTIKIMKGLKQPVKATFFSKLSQRDQWRMLFEDYKGLNPKFEFEYTDPDREPIRAKQMGIKKYGTLHLALGNKESKIEEISEEKITQALIQLLKEKSPTLCALTGHGEKNFQSQDAEGYETIQKALGEQSYLVQELNLQQSSPTEGHKGLQVPPHCDAVAILGPTRSFFDAEIQALRQYLSQGGRAILAMDLNFKGGTYAPELLPLLKDWHIEPQNALIVDPLSRMLNLDASVAILAQFDKDHSITRDFQGNCAFPLARPLNILPSAPSDLKVQWLAQTTPKSWAVNDLKALEKGEVQLKPGRDHAGPFSVAVAVEGHLKKPSNSTPKTRMIVLGTSYFATNHFARFAGNLDFFLNSVSWLMEDENLISIRPKDHEPGKVELSQKTGTLIFLLTVIVIPLGIAVAGLVIWIFRRRL